MTVDDGADTGSAVQLTHRLSATQRGFLASRSRAAGTPVQNNVHLVRIAGPVDAQRLAEAFGRVVAAVDILRTRVVDDERAIVAPPPPTATEVIALDGGDVDRWVAERSAAPLDLAVAAFDSVVLDHGSGDLTWYLNLDHVITDATTTAAIVAATGRAYAGQQVEAPSWYGWVRSSTADRPTSGGGAAAPASRLYRQSADPGATASSRHTMDADDDLETRLVEAIGSTHRVLGEDASWTVLLTAAAALWVHHVTGRDQVRIGLPVHHRATDETAGLFGPLVELHPVEVSFGTEMTARDLHRHVARQVLSTLAAAQGDQAPSHDFDVVVNVIRHSGAATFDDREVVIDWVAPTAIDPAHVARVQLTGYGDGGLAVDLDLNHATADEAHRARAAEHFRSALEIIIGSPDAGVDGTSLVDTAERATLERWGDGGPPATPVADIALALHERLATDDRVVVHDPRGDLTGRELWARASAVARHLTSTGVARGDRVSIELEPGAAALAAIYGTLAIGASFVPIDPTQPDTRRSTLTAAAGCRHRFTDPAAVLALPDVEAVTPAPTPTPDEEAYLLFTSGSTGMPKGVPITHGGLGGYLRFALDSYVAAGTAPVAPLYTSLGFDLTITSLFVPVLAGGRLVMAGSGAAALSSIASDERINWIKATPSHLEVLVRLLGTESQLSTAVVGGEAFSTHLARRLTAARPELRMFNEYGPTEAVVGCMIHLAETQEYDESPDVPIGRPAPGVTLRIATSDGAVVPLGGVGELWISHDGLTAGYLGVGAEEPADPFVQLDGRRWYRSGDLVRLRDEHRCEYLGRVDTQLKVGGRRLDPLEVEAALTSHPAIETAAVRLHQPRLRPATHRCVTCGLPDNVPAIRFDEAGVCATCRAYEAIAPAAAAYFGEPADLQRQLEAVRARTDSPWDCLHLLSGGKDSTYALYRLVDLGFRPYVLTLDNGYISEGAKDNIRRSVADLGLDHEFATTPHMAEIFRDSLATHSNVCHGCYKTIYVLATKRADELGIGAIVTGLSRGQLFETRLLPAQFRGEFDPAEIDRAVRRARMRYHRTPDLPNRVLGTELFADDAVFDRVEYLDFYRWVDVELAEMLEYLRDRTAWERPPDTGRSTNCLINIAGIHTHKAEQGYHNYAIPYAWDVRLGHKTRDEAIAELDDDPELDNVTRLLGEVGYEPSPRQTLTAWVTTAPGAALPSATELRGRLAADLPAWAIPTAFVEVDELPTTTNGKLDDDRLPEPERVHRSGVEAVLAPTTATEELVVGVWERALQIEPIGVDDDFFALGGDSLAALGALAELSGVLARDLADELAFVHTTVRDLAAAVDEADPAATAAAAAAAPTMAIEPIRRAPEVAPQPSPGEQGVLFEQQSRPDDRMYNLGRRFHVAGRIDLDAWISAVADLSADEATLRWNHGTPRTRLGAGEHLEVHSDPAPISADEATRRIDDMHQTPFDLSSGPLLRVAAFAIDDGSTELAFVIHHVCGDRTSLDALFERAAERLAGRPVAPRDLDYAEIQQTQLANADKARSFWLDDGRRLVADGPAWSGTEPGGGGDPDGLIERRSGISARDLAGARGASAVAIITAAAARTVAPWFDGSRVEVALLGTTRVLDEATDAFGYYLNPLPVTVPVEADSTEAVAATLAATSRELGRKLAHRAWPFPSIVADRRHAGLAAPAGRILVAWDEGRPLRCAGFDVSARAMFNGSAVTDLTFFAEVRGDLVVLSVEYSGTVVGRARAEQLLEAFDTALESTLRATAVPAPAAADSVLVGPPLATDASVTGRILDRLSARDTAAVALTVGESSWSDAELAARVEALAATLAGRGVGVGDRVVVSLPRSPDLIATILAVLRLGASYVPVDPSYPRDRRTAIIEAADAAVVVTHGPADVEAAAGALIDLASPSDEAASVLPAQIIDPGAEAYVIFTSGSTGVPRGVPVLHGQLDASTNARRQAYEGDPDRFLLLSSIAFDSSIVGLFWTLAEGGHLVLPTEDQAHDVDALVDLLDRADVTHTLCVPSLYRGLLSRRRAGRWPRQVIVAGESCDSDLVAEHFDAVAGSALANEYGPTEATVWATVHHCAVGDDPVPIGTPVAGSWVAVVGEDGRPTPSGVPGELVIGGAGVTGGYLNDPDATADRFADGVAGAPDGRCYHTRDLALIEGGSVYFLGRLDDQLNVGGLRVEPAEIEAVLTTTPGIDAAVVGAVDLRSIEQLLDDAPDDAVRQAMAAAAGSAEPPARTMAELLRAHGRRDDRLVAWIEAPTGVDDAELRRVINDRLAPLMRPTRWSVVPRLPRTPNGKIDRAATTRLPLPEAAAWGAVATADTGTDRSDALATAQAAFAAVLGLGAVGPDDSFFDLGGHSLLALELLGEVERRTGVSLSTAVVFADDTPRGLATHLAGASVVTPGDGGAATRSRQLIIPVTTSGSRPPIFAINNLGTNAEYFRPLAAELGDDQPFYGLGPSHRIDRFGVVDFDLDREVTVEGIAATCVDSIESIAPEGPVVVTGLCGGAIHAYEVVQQLRERGRRVAAFIMINDWQAPHLETGELERSWQENLRRRTRNLVTLRGDYLPWIYGPLKRQVELVELQMVERMGRTPNHRQQVRRYIEESMASMARYEYRPWPGPVTILRGRDDPRLAGQEGRGWGDLLRDVTFEPIDAIGIDLLLGAGLPQTVDAFRRAIDRGT